MPLDNISNNTKDDFLSVGLADALVTKLQQIPSLQVRPTSAIAGVPQQEGRHEDGRAISCTSTACSKDTSSPPAISCA